jgi:purine-binding chemotaxis protein CheW
MTTKQKESSGSAIQHLAGKYLTFGIQRESYGIDVLQVREIIRMTDITPVPQMPEYVLGVINLRGKIIPVIDLRLRFGFTEIRNTEHTCIIVVHVKLSDGKTSQMGLVVDNVEEVVSVALTDIEETPDFGTGVSSGCIIGMAKIKGIVKTLLDIDRVQSVDSRDAIRLGAAASPTLMDIDRLQSVTSADDLMRIPAPPGGNESSS